LVADTTIPQSIVQIPKLISRNENITIGRLNWIALAGLSMRRRTPDAHKRISVLSLWHVVKSRIRIVC